MDGLNKYVLFYSTKCEYSNKLLVEIEKNGLESSFTKVNIDFTDDIPAFVTHVPTVLVDKSNKISGKAVFEWVKKLTESTSLQPASADSMSDPYSFLSDNNDDLHTRYSLLDNDYGGGPSAGKGDKQQHQQQPEQQQQQQQQQQQTMGSTKGGSSGDDYMQRMVDSRANDIPQMIRRV